jgi:hypothetical protein
LDHHALGHRRGARGRRSGTALDLDETKAAGAERVEHVGRAELRDLRADVHGGRMMEVPSGTVTVTPSIVSVTSFLDLEAGVP